MLRIASLELFQSQSKWEMSVDTISYMISVQMLGQPGSDNAVFVVVDSGQSTIRLLFDCGYGCLDTLSVSEIMSIDAVFFSHFHMDHISGFDALFRFNYNRESGPPLRLVGPAETLRILQQRMQAYTWNLVDDATGKVIVSEFGRGRLKTCELLTRRAFRELSREETSSCDGTVFSTPDISVSAIELDHGCVSAGYLVREAESTNVNTSRLAELGLKPGPWLKLVKQINDGQEDEFTEIDGRSLRLGDLRDFLLETTQGSSFAYLTDFRLPANQMASLIDFIRGVDVLVCENSYANSELELARQNFHLCSREVGELAAAANVGQLVLFHLSDRYAGEAWRRQLCEVREVFPRTDWPAEWKKVLMP